MRTGSILLGVPLTLFLVWVGFQGYLVYESEMNGPFTVPPIQAMQTGYGMCLDVAKATGCPDAPYGYGISSQPCERVWFWTCASLWRADVVCNYWGIW